MKGRRFWISTSRALAILAVVALAVSAAPTGTETVLYSFSGNADGGYPDSDLIIDSAGNLYGTAVEGGTFDSGTVFELTPSGNGWTETVLYSFSSGSDGGEPYGGVTLDAQGNLYGTTVTGGRGETCEGGCGVAFKLTNSGGHWTETVIHNFTAGSDGSGPGAGLTLDSQGNLYGMTPTGGASGLGVIYELHSNNAGGNWRERVIHTFMGARDGATGSIGRLTPDASGNLYGVATVGGANGDGTAFELMPTQAGGWKFITLYSFKGDSNAGYPYGALTFDKSGNLYGTTYYYGANNLGTVYELSQSGGAWHETLLYSFKGGSDGSSPISNLVFDAAGNLYGTTSEGGSQCSCGTIFKLSPVGKGKWQESVAYRFAGMPDAGFIYNGLLPDPAGSLYYGSSVRGGTDNEGAVFQFTP